MILVKLNHIRTYLALIITCLGLWLHPAKATDLVISNNAIMCWFSDSCSGDSSTGDPGGSTGFRAVDYVHAYFAMNYPQYNIGFYNLYRSGAGNEEMETNRIQKLGLPLWGYQSNNFQHISFPLASDANDLSSNAMYLVVSNIEQALPIMSDGDLPLTIQTGWAATHPLQSAPIGGFPEMTTDGSFVQQGQRNNAMINVGNNLGWIGIDSFNSLSNGFATDFASGNNNVQFIPTGPKAGHLLSSGQYAWAIVIIRQITTDTNISTATVDWNTTTPVTTNHCWISGISKSGNTLTLTRHDDRMPMCGDLPGGGYTNDVTPIFNVFPWMRDAFVFSLQVTNLPVGNYNVAIDGVLCSTLTASQLGAGWNMFTNTSGPYAAQQKEVLGRIRDQEGADRISLIGAGTGPLAEGYGSQAGGQWAAGKRGDALIAALDSTVALLKVDDAAIHTAAQQTNHTFTITLQASYPAAPFRP